MDTGDLSEKQRDRLGTYAYGAVRPTGSLKHLVMCRSLHGVSLSAMAELDQVSPTAPPGSRSAKIDAKKLIARIYSSHILWNFKCSRHSWYKLNGSK